MSIIVLDTSVLVPDFRLRGKVFRAVLRTAQDLRDHIHLPKIVVDELINKFREQLQNSYDSLHRYEEKIRDLTGTLIDEGRIDVSEQVVIYSDWLESELSKNKIESIDYPRVSHESLVKRALARRKPFCPEGQRGYRDAILWETILTQSGAHRDEVLFVSKNTRDFADPGNSHRLHPHLIEDLHLLRHDEASVQFFDGFEDLLARALSPRQRLFPELETQVKKGILGQHELIPWLTGILPGTSVQYLRKELRHKEWVIDAIHEISKPSLSSTSRLTEHTILVILFFTFSADITPMQSEFELEEGNETGNDTFICFVSVEFELETNTIVSVEFYDVISFDV